MWKKFQFLNLLVCAFCLSDDVNLQMGGDKGEVVAEQQKGKQSSGNAAMDFFTMEHHFFVTWQNVKLKLKLGVLSYFGRCQF